MPAEKIPKKSIGGKAPVLTAGIDARHAIADSHAEACYCPLVALGGSAGSLEALQTFFHALPASTGLSFVVVLHLSPTSPSSLPELLQHWTALRVCSVRHMQRVQPDHVYVIPAGRYLTCGPGYLQLGARSATVPRRLTIDVFLRSLADSYGSRAAAILLSGADRDGSMGIQQVKERGGFTLAQDPTAAAYPTMPQSAISTGFVDAIVHPCDMPRCVVEHFSRLPRWEDRVVLDLPAREIPVAGIQLSGTLEKALDIIRERTGQDYARYRRPTLLRRLEHRIEMSGADSAPDYLLLLRESREETDTLGREFLISVTEFFRDPHHFDLLARTIPELFEGKGTDDVVRVWVPGCATGEEAYSIVMLLLEYAEKSSTSAAVQVFGTDLDVAAIMAARSGHYSHEIEAHLTADRLHRFFATDASGYRARREVREPLLFAVHDILKDAPFAHMDLVSCRNLLIYLTEEAQQEVLQTLHFSLRPGGLLFLGSAERAEDMLFSSLGAAHKLYRRLPGGRGSPRVTAAKELLARSRDLRSPVHEISAFVGTSAIEPASASSLDNAMNRHRSSRDLSSADLRASNQELFVMNQELRAATEELDINRQELQCINEELTVLNQQLSLSIDELTRVNSDLKNFIDATDLGIIFLDRNLKIMRYTPAATRLFRLIPTDLGRPLADLRHDLQYDRFESDVRAVLTEAAEMKREVADHNGRWFLTRIMPYRTIELQVAGVVLTFVDISQRKQAEEALRASETKYRTLFESIDVGFCIIDVLFDDQGRSIDYRFLEANPAFINQTGLTNAIGKTIRELAPSHEQFWFDVYGAIALSGTPARFEHQAEALPSPRWYEVFAFRVGAPDENRVAVLFRDIAGRKRREANRAFLAEVAEDFNRLTGPDEIMQAVGVRLAAFMGISCCLFQDVDEGKNEVTVSYGWSNADVPIVKHTFRLDEYLNEEFARANRAGEAFVVRNTGHDERANADNFARLNIAAFVVLPYSRREQWDGYFSVTSVEPRDWREHEIELLRELASRLFQRIERARAEAALRESEERLRAFVAATSDIVYVMSADWGTMRSLIGKEFITSTKQPRGDWMEAYIPHADQAAVWNAIGVAIRSKGTFELEHHVHRLDGTIGWINSRAVPLFNQTGDIVEWFGTASDITDRKRAEAELKARNTELERFNQVMVGRELRMMELKQEINTLQELRGAPPLYKPTGEPEASLSKKRRPITGR